MKVVKIEHCLSKWDLFFYSVPHSLWFDGGTEMAEKANPASSETGLVGGTEILHFYSAHVALGQ